MRQRGRDRERRERRDRRERERNKRERETTKVTHKWPTLDYPAAKVLNPWMQKSDPSRMGHFCFLICDMLNVKMFKQNVC